MFFYSLQKSHWPSRLKRKPKIALAGYRRRNLFSCLKIYLFLYSCLYFCYFITTVHKILKPTSRSACETWGSDDITGHTKYKRKEIKTAGGFVFLGFFCAWAWDSRIFALGHTESSSVSEFEHQAPGYIDLSLPLAVASSRLCSRKELFKAQHWTHHKSEENPISYQQWPHPDPHFKCL